MQTTSIRFWLHFHTTLPQSPSCGEGDSRVHRVQHSCSSSGCFVLLRLPRVGQSAGPKDNAVPATTGSPATHQGSRFVKWAVGQGC